MKKPSIFYTYEDLEDGVSAATVEEFKRYVRSIVKSPRLLVDQKFDALKDAAFKALPYPPLSPGARQAVEEGVVCLLSEGPAPFHPRYTAPDYQKLLEHGSAFFDLKPARNLHEATANLLAIYNYVPSRLPVFIGRLDELLEPYLDGISRAEAQAVMRSFWMLVDRLHPNAFVHGNIGPGRTRAGEMLLQVERELRTITNLTLRYDPQISETAFALECVENALQLTKPYFLNHAMMLRDWGEDYVIASCYNAMRLGGGIYTLVRLNLKELARQWIEKQGAAGLSEKGLEGFLGEGLGEAAALLMEVVNSRIRYLVEEVGWFEQDIFIAEGLLQREKFTAYAAVFGLAECVSSLLHASGQEGRRYGRDKEANQLAARITRRMADEIARIPAVHCQGSNGHAAFHAQVGIASDQGVTPGCRVPAGEEPALYEHLLAEAPQHSAVPGGISTILEFDQTAAQNPQAVLDIIRGAFQAGIRNLSIGSCQSEFVRVTGYLVRRADLEAYKAEKAVRTDSSLLGAEFIAHQQNTLHRRTRQV